MKILPVGAELFHTDGRTRMTKLTAAFHNFANAPRSWAYIRTVLHTGGYHPLYHNELVL